MYVLMMETPLIDAARLLVGRLKVDEATQRKWMDKAQRRLQPDPSRLPTALREAALFSPEDPVPEPVRSAAYRVEARRSITQSMTELVSLLLVVTVLIAGFVFLSAALVWGVLTALLGVVVVGVVYRAATARVKEAVPLRHELEPVAWALYYAVQLAQEVKGAAADLRGRGTEPLERRALDLMSRIERSENGRALPGQEDTLVEATAELTIHLPQTVSSVDARHRFAGTIASRAATAAVLVRDELRRRGVQGSSRADHPGQLAKRVYGSLMLVVERFVTLPPSPQFEEGLTAETLLQSTGVQELLKQAETIPPIATAAAQGSWEHFTGPEADLPGSRYPVFITAAGAVLVVLGIAAKVWFDESAERWADAAVLVGSVLLPGLAGRLAEKLPNLTSKSPSATAST